MSHRMILNQTAYFGVNSIHNIIDEVKKRGYQKALVVTDKELIKFKVATKVTELLDSAELDYQIFDEVMPNPTISIVKQGIEIFKQSNADYLIAIGGGSPQDTAKAIGIVINNPEFSDIRSLEGLAETKKPSIPIIAIPTTSGTAAEVTINYVITDEENKRKFVCVDPHDIPVLTLVDPNMMISMPASLKAATGIDALTHAIEGYITKGAWEMSDMFHLKAIEIISRSLRDSVNGDLNGVEQMALGQYIAGMGFSNVGLGLVHGMAHPLGAFYNVPHGVANAILLPHIMEYNAPYTGEKYRHIAKAMGIKNTEDMTIEDARNAAVNAVFQLNNDVKIPTNLHMVGVKKEDITALAEAAYADVCTQGNPRETNISDIEKLYHSVF